MKFIAKIGFKPYNDKEDIFIELPISKGSGEIKFELKSDANGSYWTTKVTAKLLREVAPIYEPCIIKVRLTDSYYILGTEDIPVVPTIKEEDLIELSIEYKSKIKPEAIKKVLSIAPECT